MEQAITISKDQQRANTLDFSFLKEKGIQYVQELCSDIWTDYNQHDPGVTILEQLCYGLTELGYRTNFSIEEILTANLHPYQKVGDNAFYSPIDILPTNPLTVIDFRKLIIDHIPEVKNAWIETVKDNIQGLKGLYRVLVQMDDDVSSKKAIAKVQQDIRALINKHRNLCEDFERIEVLKSEPIEVAARIDISPDAFGEVVLAQILYELEDVLTPDIRFHTLEEMQEEGYRMDEIFDGPTPDHGFIKDEDLKPLLSEIYISRLTKAIAGVKGVRNVKNLTIFQNGRKVYGDLIRLDGNRFAVLDMNKDTFTDGKFPIKFYKNGIPYDVDFNASFQILSSLSASRASNYKLVFNFNDINKFKEGRKQNFESYHSIQYGFPGVYGISDYGIPTTSSKLRIAQARQLKAYLLFFEQLIADYLMQLTNVRHLFELDTTVEKSYFSQIPKTIPQLDEIIVDDFENEVQQLIKDYDPFLKRRNRFIDHLLARFGEGLLAKIIANLYRTDEKGLSGTALIDTKINFLKNYIKLGKDRSKAYNYKFPSDDDNISGLVKRLKLLLNIPADRPPLLTTALQTATIELSDEEFKEVDPNEEEEEEDETTATYKEQQEEPPKDKPTTSELMLDLMKNGIKPINYLIVRKKVDKKRIYFTYYNSPYLKARIQIFQDPSYKKCKRAVDRLIQYLKGLNKKSEGFYAMEHVLLRPSAQVKYGFNLLDDRNEVLLTSYEYDELAKQQSIVEEILQIGVNPKNYDAEEQQNGNYIVVLKSPSGEAVARGALEYTSSRAARNKVEDIIDFVETIRKDSSPITSLIEYVTQRQRGYELDVDFYSLRMSLLFPDWCARFADQEFRDLLQELVVENVPAHLAVDVYWLTPEDMAKFETLYYSWLKLKGGEQLEETDAQSYRLIQLLLDFKESYHGVKLLTDV